MCNFSFGFTFSQSTFLHSLHPVNKINATNNIITFSSLYSLTKLIFILPFPLLLPLTFCLIVIVLLFSLLLITLFPPLPESPLLVEVLVQQEYVG